MINVMIRRHMLAVVRGVALFGLSVAALALSLFAVAAATLVVPYPFVARAIEALANLSRRLAGTWSGVPVEAPRRPEIPVPQQRADGWYVHDNQLFRHRHVPAFLLRIEAVSKDAAFTREWGWMFTAPFGGGVVALAPALLVAAGLTIVVAETTGDATAATLTSRAGLAVIPAGTGGVLVGAVLVFLGVAVAPLCVRLNGLWTRMLLQTASRSWWHRSGIAGWVKVRSSATWNAAGLAGLAMAAFGGSVATVLLTLVSWGGLIPFVAVLTRPLVELYRRIARQWTGQELPTPYLPYPRPPAAGEDGRFRVGRGLHPDRASAIRAQRHGWILRDPATWRDLLWSAGAPLLFLPSLIPAALVSVGFFGLFWQALWWAPWAVPVGLTSGTWVTPFYMWYGVRLLVPQAAVIPDWASVPIGLLVSLVGLLLALPVLRLRNWWDRRLLHPTNAARLAHRVAHLTETRADAVDAQAAELRRIERDLHDGAQARLISVGLTLAAIEHLLHTDPERAGAMIAQARQTSATALSELRDLVRGIHPPVLAERGLSEAVRAVALDTPVPVTVTTSLAGRAEAPIETAAYFAVCEALANAVRHAHASHIEVSLEHRDNVLTITVTDDGRGGADPGSGTGLAGIQRRLGTFDGLLRVTSPPGGPTVLVIEIPCALVTAG